MFEFYLKHHNLQCGEKKNGEEKQKNKKQKHLLSQTTLRFPKYFLDFLFAETSPLPVSPLTKGVGIGNTQTHLTKCSTYTSPLHPHLFLHLPQFAAKVAAQSPEAGLGPVPFSEDCGSWCPCREVSLCWLRIEDEESLNA